MPPPAIIILFPRRVGRRGFTLIELLATVAIMVILAALILPTISRMRSKAVQLECSNQLRQIALGLTQYASDNNMHYPPSYAPGQLWWYSSSSTALASYVGGTDALGKLSVCPANRTSTSPPWGQVGNSHGYPYVINYQVMSNLGGSSSGGAGISIFSTSHANSLIVMLDSQKGSNWGIGFTTINSGWSRVASPHLQCSNVLWFDGHVTSEVISTLTSSQVTP